MDYQFLPKGKKPKEVTKISLSGMNLTSFPLEVLCYPNLRKLDISHNELNALPVELESLRKLEVLNVSYNNLREIPSFVFKLPKLNTIAAGHNQICDLSYQVSFSHITDMILDYNQIDFFTPSTIMKLRKLVISHNRLNIGFVRNTFPNMKYVDVRSNPCILFAGHNACFPNAKHFYHDPKIEGKLVPEGLQYYF